MGYYWEQNKIYILITITIFIIWLVILALLFIDINIQVASSNNETCSNPVAMYFDKANRDKCLRLAAEKKSVIVQKIEKAFEKNVENVIKKTQDVAFYFLPKIATNFFVLIFFRVQKLFLQ